MTQQETLRKIAEETGLTVSNVKAVFESYAATAKSAFLADRTDKVPLPGIGTLTVRHSNARTGHNPKTGEPVAIAEQDRPVLANFKSSELFKALN